MLKPMAPNSALFLWGENREQPLHVAGLQLFTPPPGSTALDVRALFDQAMFTEQVNPLLLKRPVRSLASMGQWAWAADAEFDIEHHVRRSALPRPGRIRDLLAVCGRLHSAPLDRQRPLWEMHLIEGLEDGRLATYFKVHHSLLDGASSVRLLRQMLSGEPDARGMPAPWAATPGSADPGTPASSQAGSGQAGSAATGSAATGSADAAGLLDPAALAALRRGAAELTELTPALLRRLGGAAGQPAPRTMFNVPITGSRRVAAQSWPLHRLRAVSKASGTTVNDVLLAMCAGALRTYLLAEGALPERSLVAMVPVALARAGAPADGGGNSVGAVLCDLATAEAHPAARLLAISASMRQGKAELAGMSQVQALALTALALSPIAVQQVLRLSGRVRPPFNLVISNLPGPRRPMYWNGARLDGMFPMSLPLDGQALNITCTSYTDQLAFGIVACRRSVPHVQRLLVFLEESLLALEAAVC